MASLRLANGQEVQELRVWNGTEWTAKKGKYFDSVNWIEFVRQKLTFKDDMVTPTGLSRQSFKTVIKEHINNFGFIEDFETLNYTHKDTIVNSNTNGILNLTANTRDPWINMFDIFSLNPNKYRYVEMRYRIINNTPSAWEIFFTNDLYSGATGQQRIWGNLNHDGNWHTTRLDGWVHANWRIGGNIKGFRFDYVTAPNVNIEIEYIAVVEDDSYGNTFLVENNLGLKSGEEITIDDGTNREDTEVVNNNLTSFINPQIWGLSSIAPKDGYYDVMANIDAVAWGLVTDRNIGLDFLAGQEYTLSFELKSDNLDILRYSYIISNSGNQKINNIAVNKPTEWTKFSATFVPTVDRLNAGVLIGGDKRGEPTGISYSIRNLKIEEGNKASIYTPYMNKENIVSTTTIKNNYKGNATLSRTNTRREGNKLVFDTLERYKIGE